MKRPACCRGTGASQVRRLPRVLGLLVSGAMFLLVPKCPACLAAQAALLTGASLSLPAAAHLRVALLLGSFTLPAALGLAWLRRRRSS